MEKKAASIAAMPEEKTEVCTIVWVAEVGEVEGVGMYSMALSASSRASRDISRECLWNV